MMRGRSISKVFVFLLALTMMLSMASAICQLNVKLLNQDPIEAIPGDYVRVVFQVTGIENSECGTINFNLLPNYPFTLDPGMSPNASVVSGTRLIEPYTAQATIPFTLRVDDGALNKKYSLDASLSNNAPGSIYQKLSFDISIKDVRTAFEVAVQDYDSLTHLVTLSILNAGNENVNALTADIINKDKLSVKGATQSIIGSLDSSQDSTFTYEIAPQPADMILNLSYTDINGHRRAMEKTVHFDPSYFTGRQKDVKKTSTGTYVILVIIILLIVFWAWKKFTKKKEKKSSH